MEVTRRTALGLGLAAGAAVALDGAAASAAGRPVIFVTPHPDDETLAFSVMLRRHVTAGRDVHVLLVTNRTITAAVGHINGLTVSPWWRVRHDPAAEGYAPLTQAAADAARRREQLAALRCHGIGPDRVHYADLPEGSVTVAGVKAAVVALADRLGPGTGLWSTSYVADVHPDHLACGRAVRELGRDQPTRFYDRRYVILWTHPDDYPLRGLAPHLAWGNPATADERDREVAACRSYAAWQPASGAFAVGMHSVPTLFPPMIANPRALVHRDS